MYHVLISFLNPNFGLYKAFMRLRKEANLHIPNASAQGGRCAAAPMHMAMWGHGRVDADEGSIIDAILGIPAYTIKMAGIHGLPEDYMMQISARGSAYKPDIDWLRWAPGDCH